MSRTMRYSQEEFMENHVAIVRRTYIVINLIILIDKIKIKLNW